MINQEANVIKTYGQKVEVRQNKINVSIEGEEHQRTIVLLPGFGTDSPVIDFSPMTELLSKKYKIVTIKPFGYGLSDVVSAKRNLENISTELHETLQALEIKQYVLMGHSIAGIYTLDYMDRYKNEVDTCFASFVKYVLCFEAND